MLCVSTSQLGQVDGAVHHRVSWTRWTVLSTTGSAGPGGRCSPPQGQLDQVDGAVHHKVKDTPAAPVEETPLVTDPQSQLQPYDPQPYPYYPQPYPYDPLTTQLLPNLQTLTPGEQAQSSSLSSEEEASPPVVYTRVMLPPVVPAYQSQGLSVDPNPEPSVLTPDPLPLTPDPGHAHLGNPPTVAPMASGGQGTPKPEVGGAVGVQMKSAVEKGTEGAVGVREGGGVQMKSGGAGDPCPLEKSPPVRETQTSTHSDPRLTHRLTPRQLPIRARSDGRRA
ncbi:splicing factor, proline- and glutamine-rich-like [Oncorhynchus mykiss]|uniref:splicing factor, proline- and glutamine-rich-like n=1 Tax=Oncorhynchus mykiss TaxID=8022 RepID=UPI0018775D90|nr:splicing factor, proline- and glutamine-rich-like [Oncorhynchus mykiss]